MNTAVITGAGSGIGRAVALKFAAEGWRVALVGRAREPLAETAARAGADAGARPASFPCDVSAPDAVATHGRGRARAVWRRRRARQLGRYQRAAAEFRALSLDDWHARAGDQPPRRVLLRARVSARHARAPHRDDRQHQLRRRQGRARYRRTGIRVVEIRSDGPDAADQRGGARERRARVLDLSRATSTRRCSTSGRSRRRRRRARACCSPRIWRRACGWSRRSRRAPSSTRFRCRPGSADEATWL